MAEQKEELIVVEKQPVLPYKYAAGRYGSVFLNTLRDEGVILASTCAACGHVATPPRQACPGCFGQMDELVPVGPRGRLMTYTTCYLPFLNPATGIPRDVPYGYGMIRLDGSGNGFFYFLAESDPAKMRIGMRVEAVLKPREERTGQLDDILHFKEVEEDGLYVLKAQAGWGRTGGEAGRK